jgi:hypothetical protein
MGRYGGRRSARRSQRPSLAVAGTGCRAPTRIGGRGLRARRLPAVIRRLGGGLPRVPGRASASIRYRSNSRKTGWNGLEATILDSGEAFRVERPWNDFRGSACPATLSKPFRLERLPERRRPLGLPSGRSVPSGFLGRNAERSARHPLIGGCEIGPDADPNIRKNRACSN